MKPISLLDEYPPDSMIDAEGVWWWDQLDECWRIGIPLLFGEDSTVSPENPYARYSHWLPIPEIPFPE